VLGIDRWPFHPLDPNDWRRYGAHPISLSAGTDTLDESHELRPTETLVSAAHRNRASFTDGGHSIKTARVV
jgi:hypothetical protein